MALRDIQKEMAITLFVKAFSAKKNDENRKELFIQFSDSYGDSIKDWQCKVEAGFQDETDKVNFMRLVNKTDKKDTKDFVTIEALKKENLEQISYLASKELGYLPWVVREDDDFESLLDFINSGYSYVAKNENVIWGFILAYKCPTYGGYYSIFIDTLVVNRDVQGNGIGKMLLDKVKDNMFRKRIFSINLMTQKDLPAYKIYRHLGFEENEKYVYMRR